MSHLPKSKKALVIIPTYNEREVIGKMIDALCDNIFKKINGWECHLLIVDDTSPDKTYEVVRLKQKRYNNLHLYLNETKLGIGNAYVQGFKYGINKLKADVLIEIDGDFQHPPESIIDLLKEIDRGADYVMGSRKIKGGTIPKGWGFKRIFFSQVGGFVARFIMFFPFKSFLQVTDPTTGLKASRVKGFVDQMNMDNLYSLKFGYKIEFLFQMVTLGAKVKEIPLKFQLRQIGESKIDTNTALDVFRTAINLRFRNPMVKNFS
ncbi:glycosyltransferase [Patescibacteria group bacterium]|nr:glycosyltransferase [Patescibacteria group bacterium]MCG2702181.1 glycosyltransferase [Candidatus Parcubacteria bacterium]MBU4265335.1 glycosyltransferase [Patescibacteria group bacterium]MBU4390775.1 glycosyltransferase [Patescibacteria group bacterium]MBU4397198.1 glycosyltransferase [Patescibacteria group bacterium]